MLDALEGNVREEANGWHYWNTPRLAIAEYASDDLTAAVTCVEGTIANWVVRAGAAHFAEGVVRGDNAFADAIAQVRGALRRFHAAGPIDRQWSPLMFRSLNTRALPPPSDVE